MDALTLERGKQVWLLSKKSIEPNQMSQMIMDMVMFQADGSMDVRADRFSITLVFLSIGAEGSDDCAIDADIIGQFLSHILAVLPQTF